MPYTLLLADDSVTIQRVIELTFADEDVTVVAVGDGDQAVARLDAEPPDIVLADIGMPGKNGYEVARYIRQSPRLAHIPVVLLTGACEPVDQARANAAGCDGILAKPFEPPLVVSMVKELLSRGHSGPDAPGPIPTHGPPGDVALPSSSDSIWSKPAAGQQRLAAMLADPQVASAPTGPVPRTQINDYFDRLDAAFSTLSNTPAPDAALLKQVPEPAPFAPFEIDTNIDWFAQKVQGAGAAAEPWNLPASPFATQIEFADSRDDEPVAAAAVHVEALPVTEPERALVHAAPVRELPILHRPPLPALADAFAALLAAEQADPDASAGLWPAAAPAAGVSTDALTEAVTRRVLERLSGTAAFRAAVADATSKIAERLIREEIARIKASIV